MSEELRPILTDEEIQQKDYLVSLGADWEGGRDIWLDGHCFYLHPEDGLIEL